jgi:structural maintenance of chromosome 2
LSSQIRETEENIRCEEEEEKLCKLRIASYQKMLNEYDIQNDTKRMSEREAEGLVARQRYLIKSTAKLQN